MGLEKGSLGTEVDAPQAQSHCRDFGLWHAGRGRAGAVVFISIIVSAFSFHPASLFFAYPTPPNRLPPTHLHTQPVTPWTAPCPPSAP